MIRSRKKLLFILVFLCAVMLTSTACDISRLNPVQLFRSSEKNDGVIRPEMAGRMTRVELLQTIILTLNNQISVDAAFESIPPHQSDNMTLTEFSQYIAALKRAVSGAVTSFSPISAEESTNIATDISDQTPAIANLARSSAYYKLAYKDEAGRNAELVIALQIDGENTPYLSREWILRINRIFDFLQLYFSAIETKNHEALAALLKLGETAPLSEGLLEAFTSKSEETIEFYTKNVTTGVTNFSLRTLLPSKAVVEQYAAVGSGESRREESRRIQFLSTNGSVFVLDRIPETIAPEDFEIWLDDELLFQVGSTEYIADSDTLDSCLGQPLAHNNTNCKTNINGLKNFEFPFLGLVITGEGNCENHKKWSGIVYGASLSYSRFSLGSGLRVGLPVSALYKHYPFARENNYQFSGTVGDQTYSLVVQVEQDYITKLSITIVNN